MNNTNSLFCQTVLDPETKAAHGIEGSEKTMFYVRLANEEPIVTCPTCKDQLVAGSKGKITCRYASVAAVRALANFRIELVDALEVVNGHCSFRACNCKLEGSKMVVRHEQEFRRICGGCSGALDIIATSAKKQLELHASGKRLLSKRDLPVIEAEAKLMPEKDQAAIEAIRVLQQKASDRIKAAQRLVEAQLPQLAKKPEPKAATPKVEAKKPEPKAEKKERRTKGSTSHRAPGIIARTHFFDDKPTVRLAWWTALMPDPFGLKAAAAAEAAASVPAPKPPVAPAPVAKPAAEVQVQA